MLLKHELERREGVDAAAAILILARAAYIRDADAVRHAVALSARAESAEEAAGTKAIVFIFLFMPNYILLRRYVEN